MEIKKLKSVIIDDSEMQRIALSKLVEKHPNLILKGCYRSGIQAKNNEVDKNADLIFLDIEMPFVDGFDLLESFTERPQVIIISGRADHALKAFDYDVADYLLKPIKDSRFDTAIKRVMRNIEMSRGRYDENHLFVKSNFRKVKVNYSDIKWVEALGDYIKLVTEKSNILVLTSMKAFDQRLPDEQFLRIHKSYIVNLNRIDNFNNTVVQIDGKKMPLSRKRKVGLLNALGVR